MVSFLQHGESFFYLCIENKLEGYKSVTRQLVTLAIEAYTISLDVVIFIILSSN